MPVGLILCSQQAENLFSNGPTTPPPAQLTEPRNQYKAKELADRLCLVHLNGSSQETVWDIIFPIKRRNDAMPSEAFRQKVISTLIDEIALLSSGRFEQFGYRMMEIIYPAQWVERGTTVDGAPRGYTVDASAHGSVMVAEMSSESDYFHGDMEKPKRDLLHALGLHPDAKRIWLLSSREATAAETTKCANLATEFEKLHPALTDVEILDSRRIAKHIFENVEVERTVNVLSVYLPSIGRLADENAFSHRVPIYSNYHPRPDIEDAVINRLADVSWVTIAGMSGIGKSAIAAQVAEKMGPDFDIVIWHDGHDLRNTTELSDIDIRRTGTRHNIDSLLHLHKCLLILDDTVLPINQLEIMDYGESKEILTCQMTSDPMAITVRDLSPDSAKFVLETNMPTPCPAAVFQRVFASIGGYPLLLSILNGVARHEGWAAVNTCCEDAAISMEDERHDKVCQRILARHRDTLGAELEFVKWCNTSRFDPELASVCVSNRAVNNLQKRSFLSASVWGEIRVHDVVYRSICSVIDVPPQHDILFRDKIDGFICTECENEKSSLMRIVRIHSALFKRLLGSDRRPSFVYAVALARAEDTPLDLLGDPVTEAKRVARRDNWNGREIEIRAVVEAVEARYTITSSNKGVEAAETSLRCDITALELLRDSPAANGELLRDLRHHHAKMLVRLHELRDAEAEFRYVLAEHPTFAAGRLQLARILERTGHKQDALAEGKSIIKQHEDGKAEVPLSILLEALKLVATIGGSKDLEPYEEVIMSSLALVRDLDKALALRLIASVTQKTWFTMPNLVARMFDSIEWRDAVPTSDHERFDWAQAHKSAAKITDVGSPRRKEFLLAADDTYKSITNPNSYQLIQHAEALILMKEYASANNLLDRVPEEKREAFWWQRKAQALLGLKEYDPALQATNSGILLLKDKKYKAAFLHDRYQVRKALSDSKAVEDLKEAIDALPEDDKYRKELEDELEREIGR